MQSGGAQEGGGKSEGEAVGAEEKDPRGGRGDGHDIAAPGSAFCGAWLLRSARPPAASAGSTGSGGDTRLSINEISCAYNRSTPQDVNRKLLSVVGTYKWWA